MSFITNVVNFKQYIYIGLIALVIGAGVSGVITWKNTSDNYKDQITLMQTQHAAVLSKLEADTQRELLAALRDKTSTEKRLQDYKDELTKDFAKRTASLNSAINDLRNVQLRDPGKTATDSSGANGSVSPSQGSSSGNGSSTIGGELLSESASQFLFSQSAEAQTYLNRLIICRAWVYELETRTEEYNKKLAERRTDK